MRVLLRALAVWMCVLGAPFGAVSPVQGAVALPDPARPGPSADAAPLARLAPADDAGLRAADRALPEGTTRLRTTAYSLVAVTWRGAVTPAVAIRVHSAGHWRAWRPLGPLEDLGERSAVRGTEPLWVGRADGIRVRVNGGAQDVQLVLIDPGPDPDTEATPADFRRTAPKRPPKHAPRPELRSRKNWGAQERWRSTAPRYNRTIQQVHIHHTATANSYKRGDVRGILRSIYRYHTHNLGWSDIGYNFLVDRFGRAWVGRAGGPGKPVRGAHTLGFNHTSTGISVIGNFELKAPRAEVIRTLVRLAAWKLDAYDRDPRGTAAVFSHGSDKYADGKKVKLPVIDGHRDTNDTACPGQYLYDLLPKIRKRAGDRVDRFS